MNAPIPKDPIILYSYVNTQLRDHYDSLDELCDDLELDKHDLLTRLAMVGFAYDPATNQFR